MKSKIFPVILQPKSISKTETRIFLLEEIGKVIGKPISGATILYTYVLVEAINEVNNHVVQ